MYLQTMDGSSFAFEVRKKESLAGRAEIEPIIVGMRETLILGLSTDGEGFICSRERNVRDKITHFRFNNNVKFRDTPGRWQGYDAVDVIVLAGLPAEGVSADQERAIVDWVRAGGLLILCPGGLPARYDGTLIEEISPVRILGTRLVEGVPPFEEVYGAIEHISKRIGLSEAVLKDGEVHLQMGQLPLVVSRREGVGHVVFVAFDLSNERMRRLKKLTYFYRELLSLNIGLPAPNKTNLPAAMSEVLDQQMGVRVLPRWAVGIFLGFNFVTVAVLLTALHKRREWGFAVLLAIAPCVALLVNLAGGAVSGISEASVGNIHVMRTKSGDSHAVGTSCHALLAEGESHIDVTLLENPQCFPGMVVIPALGGAGSRVTADTMRSVIEFADDDLKWLQQLHVRPRTVSKFQTDFLTEMDGAVETYGEFGPKGVKITVTNNSNRTFSDGFVAYNRNAARIEDLSPRESTSVLLDRGTAQRLMTSFSRMPLKPKEEVERERVFRAFYTPRRTNDVAQTGVLAFGWIEGEQLGLRFDGFDTSPRAKSRTLWAVSGDVSSDEANVLLPKGTAAMYFREVPSTVYSKGQWMPILGSCRMEVDFAVPRKLRGMKATKITIFFSTAQAPAAVAIQALNNDTGQFDLVAGETSGDVATPVPLRKSSFSLANPQVYLSAQDGEVRLRVIVEAAKSQDSMAISRQPIIEDFDIEIEGTRE